MELVQIDAVIANLNFAGRNVLIFLEMAPEEFAVHDDRIHQAIGLTNQSEVVAGNQLPVTACARHQDGGAKEMRNRNREDCKRVVVGVHQADLVAPDIPGQLPRSRDSAWGSEGVHRKMSDWKARFLEFLSAQSLRPKASHMGFESGTIERFRELRHLPLAAALIQL